MEALEELEAMLAGPIVTAGQVKKALKYIETVRGVIERLRDRIEELEREAWYEGQDE